MDIFFISLMSRNVDSLNFSLLRLGCSVLLIYKLNSFKDNDQIPVHKLKNFTEHKAELVSKSLKIQFLLIASV